MSDDSEFDDGEMDRLLNDLGEFSKTTEKRENSIAKISTQSLPIKDTAKEPERDAGTGGNGSRRGSATDAITTATPATKADTKSNFNSRFSNDKLTTAGNPRPINLSSTSRKTEGNALLAGLFGDPNPDDQNAKNKRNSEPVKPFPSTTGGKATNPEPRPTSGVPEPSNSRDWLGIGTDDENDQDIIRALRIGKERQSQTENVHRQQAERPLKTVTTLNESPIIEIKAHSTLSQPGSGSFEDKMPQGLNFNQGSNVFEDKFSSLNVAPSTPNIAARPSTPALIKNVVKSVPTIPTSTAGGGSEDERKAFLQSLFGNKGQSQSQDTGRSQTPVETTENPPQTVVRKKVVTTKKQSENTPANVRIPSSSSTLQVASHLIDEDELKAMSSSLKALYTNHQDMMEKSYLEQMHCLTQSHLRKEDMLKEEIRAIHKDYESRLERLKNEMQETDNRSQIKTRDESITGFSSFVEQLKTLQNKIDTLSLNSPSPLTTSNLPDISLQMQSIVKDVDQNIQIKLSTFERAIKNTLEEKLTGLPAGNTLNLDVLRPEIREISHQMENLHKKRKHEIIKYGNLVLQGNTTALESAISKISEIQRKVGETQGKKILNAIIQDLETQRSVYAVNKEKSSMHTKEFREDLRRLISEFENKNEILRQSQSTLQTEQKQMSQSLLDLNNWLQAHFSRDTHLGNAQSKIQNSLLQTELETQLLKDERRAASEAMAEMNVERRKLNEEKIALEHERRGIEREKNRLQDLQNKLRDKIHEAEEIQTQAESAKETNYRIAAEMTRQQNEIEKDRIRQKESLQSAEESLRVQHEAVFREKLDMIREREFFEKLRNQMLCTSCLKSIFRNNPHGQGHALHNLGSTVGHTPGQRSIGDGLDKPILSQTYQTNSFGFDWEDEYWKNEMELMDSLYLGYPKAKS